MRIRSIKPEFWRSADISHLALEDRLLFVGVWSYVDDNGVGIDKLSTISADLFADDLERDAPETFARVSRGLQNLADRGLIVRYHVEGRPFLEVLSWDRQQRVDKPNKPRFPRSDDTNAKIRESVAKISSTLAPGTGEQGNRGTEEQRNSSSSSDAFASDDGEGKKRDPRDAFSADVLRLCDLLADLIRGNGNKVGTVGITWWQACERLIRIDGYTVEQIEWLIAWSQQDEFWLGVIRSMTKFREKFDTLKAQAISKSKPRAVGRGQQRDQAARDQVARMEQLEREGNVPALEVAR